MVMELFDTCRFTAGLSALMVTENVRGEGSRSGFTLMVHSNRSVIGFEVFGITGPKNGPVVGGTPT